MVSSENAALLQLCFSSSEAKNHHFTVYHLSLRPSVPHFANKAPVQCTLASSGQINGGQPPRIQKEANQYVLLLEQMSSASLEGEPRCWVFDHGKRKESSSSWHFPTEGPHRLYGALNIATSKAEASFPKRTSCWPFRK